MRPPLTQTLRLRRRGVRDPAGRQRLEFTGLRMARNDLHKEPCPFINEAYLDGFAAQAVIDPSESASSIV